ncbi:MAG: TetR/AcrR family transcriptional regulator [Clostridiales bacterium]|nr:TetR/AcrR family transcriptional regulator [Clostridiales bacterium]
MPKQTFFNLSEQKRRLIEQAALDEFSEYGFDSSSMNRIVKQGKFAKGSFYQYFDDKKDLYFYLIDSIYKKKMQCIKPILKNYKEHSFSYNIENLLRAGLEFAKSDQRLQRIGEDFAAKHQEYVNEFIEKYSFEAEDIYSVLLNHACERGELRENVNIQIVSFFISSLINQTTVHLMSRFAQSEFCDAAIQEMRVFIEHAVLK